MIGECDQRLVLGAIVPHQHTPRHPTGLALVEDALKVRFGVLVLGREGEERGGGQLLAVPHHDELPPPDDRAYGILGADLGRLIEDDHVKARPFPVQELGHGERAHEHARLEQPNEVPALGQHCLDGLPLPLQLGQAGDLHLLLEEHGVGRAFPLPPQVGLRAGSHARPAPLHVLPVKLVEARYQPHLAVPTETCKRRIGGQGLLGP